MQGNEGKITSEDLKEIMRMTLSDPILLKLMGRKDYNHPKDLKKFKELMHRNSDWAELHRKEYPETWKFNFDDSHQDGFYYYFTNSYILVIFLLTLVLLVFSMLLLLFVLFFLLLH